jgi:hypothetical protein
VKAFLEADLINKEDEENFWKYVKRVHKGKCELKEKARKNIKIIKFTF